ncbi:MAG: hypothetical protein K2M70_15235 [Lachnospiraceae bacterium]|nr:hypothetical protein [Lachnospiraceae bacterium]
MGYDYIIRGDYQEWIDKLRELICAQERMYFSSADRNKTFAGCHTITNDILFYDKKYYYITEDVFEMACSSLSCYIGRCELKHALVEAGILVGEGVGRKYFSVKLLISTPEGLKVIGRRMRIIREWLDRPGELAWHEKIEMQKNGGENCD